MAPGDLNIEINDRLLTITAERRHEERSQNGNDQTANYQWIEQQYGTFSRSMTLPRSVDTQKIEARYNHGVLELTIPKLESAKPRRIPLLTEERDDAPLMASFSASDQNVAHQEASSPQLKTAPMQTEPNEPKQLEVAGAGQNR